mmetsp:Transcript_118369/g.339753  ORF Transcript_118369/g.339753 Transcript_118369/m.339753 type:complete len:262 (+) Transcript_118369:1739-2524(+)
MVVDHAPRLLPLVLLLGDAIWLGKEKPWSCLFSAGWYLARNRGQCLGCRKLERHLLHRLLQQARPGSELREVQHIRELLQLDPVHRRRPLLLHCERLPQGRHDKCAKKPPELVYGRNGSVRGLLQYDDPRLVVRRRPHGQVHGLVHACDPELRLDQHCLQLRLSAESAPQALDPVHPVEPGAGLAFCASGGAHFRAPRDGACLGVQHVHRHAVRVLQRLVRDVAPFLEGLRFLDHVGSVHVRLAAWPDAPHFQEAHDRSHG